jgi:DNA-binding Lrp family transcriptional regulator
MNMLLLLFKDIKTAYNANTISKQLNITPMGALKILKRLEKQKIITSKQFGKAVFYKPADSDYARTCFEFLLKKEAEEAKPKIRQWVKELRKLENSADIGILFGSIMKKDTFKDVDVLLVLKQSQTEGLNRSINSINRISVKKIHHIIQTGNDLKENIKKGNPVALNALKQGIVLFGYDKLIGLIHSCSSTFFV